MVYHLFEETNFLSKDLLDVICINNCQKFVVYKAKNKLNDSRFIYIDNLISYIYFIRNLSNKDVIVFHNFIFLYKYVIIFFIKNNTKIHWAFWGAELYVLRDFKENILPKTYDLYGRFIPFTYYFRKRIVLKYFRVFQWYLFKYILLNRISNVLTNIKEDFNLINSLLDNKLNYDFFCYFVRDESFSNINLNNLSNKVLVGHSAYQGCNHIESIESIKFFECEITVPLSYGESKYKEFLIDYINEKYSNLNINLITNYLSYNDYIQFLSFHSTFILNSTHQVGFNNVLLCISLGMKVYLRKENSIYLYLKRLGFIIFNIQDDEINLAVLNNYEKKYNLDLVYKFFNKNTLKKQIFLNSI